MKFSVFKGNFRKIKNNSERVVISNLILVGMLAVSLYLNFVKETVVISNVNESCDVLEISSSQMNPETHQRIAFFLATELGNITPANAKYVTDSVMPYIGPLIYDEVKELIALQIKSIKEDEVTTSFIAEKATYEKGITFITGKYTTTGATGITKRSIKTYEFKFDVQNYTPTVGYLTLYDGVPHTRKWHSKNSNKKD